MKHHEAIHAFVKVSKERPASITAQSATLALLAKKDRRLLPRLKQLVDDDDSIETLVKIANAAHDASGNTFVHQRRVNWGNVAMIINANISRTTRFLSLSEGDLHAILEMDPHDPLGEQLYAAHVDKRFFPTHR